MRFEGGPATANSKQSRVFLPLVTSRHVSCSFSLRSEAGPRFYSRRPRTEGAGRRFFFFRGLAPRPKGERSEAFGTEGGGPDHDQLTGYGPTPGIGSFSRDRLPPWLYGSLCSKACANAFAQALGTAPSGCGPTPCFFQPALRLIPRAAPRRAAKPPFPEKGAALEGSSSACGLSPGTRVCSGRSTASQPPPSIRSPESRRRAFS